MVNKNLIKLKEILDKSNIEYDYNKILKNLKKDLKNKKYGLVWEDSKEKADKLLEENIPTLKEEKALRIENTKKGPNHIIIEGDNLLGLKSLETSNKKVDVIYIDPPYNTGKEFTYNDKLVDNEDCYRHSKWLSFMHKRLKVARNLLVEDGVIFISIDNNEQANLKLLMDEVFGEENFISNIIWHKRVANLGIISNDVEYILVYSKNKSKVIPIYKDIEKGNWYGEKISRKYINPDKDNRGPWRAGGHTKTKNQNPYAYSINLEDGKILEYIDNPKYPIYSSSRWRYSPESLAMLWKDNRLYWVNKKNKVSKFKVKKFKSEETNSTTPKSIITKDMVMTSEGKKDFKKLGFSEELFAYPKPVKLLKHLIKMKYGKNITVLDFFAGSGTTLQAVMELNEEDGGNRQCILINNNEVSNTKTAKFLNNNYNTDFKLTKAGKLSKRKSNLEKFNKFLKTDKFKKIKESYAYKNLGICRGITYERGRRVVQGYKNNKGDKITGLNNNNLYYYEIKLLSKSLTEFESLDKLKSHTIELIKIKHDAFYLKEVSKDKDRDFYTGKEDVIISHKIYVDDDFVDYVNKRITDKPMNVYIDESLLNDIKLIDLNTKNIYPIPEKFINWEAISRKESIA